MHIHNLPNTPHKRFLEISYSLALSSPGVGGKQSNRFRLGAIIIDAQNHILAAKHNLKKTHPKLIPFFKYPYLHAEAYAILSLGLDQCKNHILYVCRIYRDNTLALAKPCHECLNLSKYVGIKTIYYTTDTGYEKIKP